MCTPENLHHHHLHHCHHMNRPPYDQGQRQALAKLAQFDCTNTQYQSAHLQKNKVMKSRKGNKNVAQTILQQLPICPSCLDCTRN